MAHSSHPRQPETLKRPLTCYKTCLLAVAAWASGRRTACIQAAQNPDKLSHPAKRRACWLRCGGRGGERRRSASALSNGVHELAKLALFMSPRAGRCGGAQGSAGSRCMWKPRSASRKPSRN